MAHLLNQLLRQLLHHLVRAAMRLLLVVLVQPNKPNWTNFVNDLGSKP
jgi:hypothetical protein